MFTICFGHTLYEFYKRKAAVYYIHLFAHLFMCFIQQYLYFLIQLNNSPSRNVLPFLVAEKYWGGNES